MSLIKNDTLRSRSNSPHDARENQANDEQLQKINIDEVDLDLLRSQRSYFDQDVEL